MSFERIWHSSYVPGVPRDLTYEKITMGEALRRSAERHPGATALIYMGKFISYKELDALVDRFAKALGGMGIQPGDTVATLLPNLPQMVIAAFAAARIGATISPTNPLYTERELAYQLDDCDAKALISLDLLMPRVLAVREKTKIKNIVVCHINDYLPFPLNRVFPLLKHDMYKKAPVDTDIVEFLPLIAAQEPGRVEDAARWEDTAVLIYTGGTTGVSKGAMLTHANIMSHCQQLRAWIPGIDEGNERTLSVFPYFHAAGFTGVMSFSVYLSCSIVLLPRPEPASFLHLMKKYRPGFLTNVPTFYNALLNMKGFAGMDLSFLKTLFSGGAALSMDTLKQLQSAVGSAGIMDTFGMTEASCVITMTPYRGRIKQGTAGVPISDTDLKIVDLETGEREMPPGEPGEIIARGPQFMKGYYKKPEETARALRNGWMYTGDIGTLDADGYLTVTDRKKDMIIASGYNIYPREIDEVLYAHPKILEACAIGVPDEKRGETVKAYVVVKPGESLSAAEVLEYCRGQLAAYKAPKSVEFIDALPKSAIGKVLRKELRAMEENAHRVKAAS